MTANMLKRQMPLALILSVLSVAAPVHTQSNEKIYSELSQTIVDLDHALGAPTSDYDAKGAVAKDVFGLWAAAARKEGHASLVDNTLADVGVCLDWKNVQSFPSVSVRFEHWWSDHEDPIAEASERILQRCKEWKVQNQVTCSCEMVRQGRQISMQVPEEIIRQREDFSSEGLRSRSRYIKAKKTVLIDSPLKPDHLQNHEAALGFGSAMPIQYPYSDVDYSQACWGTRSYVLAPVPQSQHSAVMERLSKRVAAGLHGCLQTEIDQPPEIDQSPRSDSPPAHTLSETHCSIAKRVSFERFRHGAGLFPKNLDQAIKHKDVKEVWVEATVQVDDKHFPMRMLKGVLPLAVRTNDKLFVGVEVSWPTPGWACAVSTKYDGRKILDTARCTDRMCEEIHERMLLEILTAFSRPPISAQRRTDSGPPGQYYLVREYEQSLVLGNPFYENSHYLLRTWSSSEDFPALVYLKSHYRGVGHGSRLFF